MKKLQYYTDKNLHDQDAVFADFMANLKPSNTLWTFFVNWEKVFRNTTKIEVELNILNYMIGKDDFDNELKALIKTHPEVVKAIPALIVRDAMNKQTFDILIDYSNGKLLYQQFDFSKTDYTEEEVDNLLEFVDKTGIKHLLKDEKIKNLVDYMIGVEAGLDSNGRKNRGGDAMESICEAYIKAICESNGYKYLKQADAALIKREFGYDVPVDKSSRRYDFAINTGKQLTIVEVNYYGGGGSKLKATAGEYKGLQNILRDKFNFVWITDGNGWKTTTLPLKEAFDNNDYVINLDALESGALEEILNINRPST